MAKQPARPGDTGQSSVPAEAEQASMRMVDATTPDQGEANAAAQVPSYRLREEADARRAAEARAANLEQALWAANAQANANANPAPQTPQESPLVSRFGDPEDGAREAYDAVRDTAQEVLSETEERLYNRIIGEMDSKFGSITATYTSAQQLSQMTAEGLLDGNAEVEMGKRMAQKINENKAWSLQENQQNLIDTVYMEMLRSGRLKPQSGPPAVAPGTPSNNGQMPLQPGGGGGTTQTQEQIDSDLRNIQKAYPKTLGDLDIEALRALDPGANTQQSSAGQPVSYVHTR